MLIPNQRHKLAYALEAAPNGAYGIGDLVWFYANATEWCVQSAVIAKAFDGKQWVHKLSGMRENGLMDMWYIESQLFDSKDALIAHLLKEE